MSSYYCVSEYFWNGSECVPCEQVYPITAGYEFNRHCGRQDNGGHISTAYKTCDNGKFNNGSFLTCRLCSTCTNGKLLSPCTNTSDARCCEDGQWECRELTTERRTASTESITSAVTMDHTTVYKTVKAHIDTPSISDSTTWICLGAVFFIIICVIIYMLYIIKKRKHPGFREKKWIIGRSLKNNVILEDGNRCITYTSRQDNVEFNMAINDLLSPDIQAASLQTMLNDLDVVDELVFLLDPDTPGVKSTRHLAANCSIPFIWINYAYSMKDSKSPLIALLERVIANHPHWNVGHFAGLLSHIGRNDAVLVLRKLTLSTMVV
ncbi:hypothetical protein P4O66_018048 [Electrophorus voltai]|uniref:TNFR-Cys domain-containing protein n=1 Tax=Electrophorus voltai TaxID=2609070 RepID=A0AAD8YT28_9TELE|nr:hypothetical protein P4O66_018048 [Electrophorus voltai]